MAAHASEDSITDLDCPICYERFKDPRILNCGHTFCLSCLSKICNHSWRPTIQCPTCKRTTEIPLGGVSSLVVNWTVKKTVHIADELLAARSALRSQIPSCKPHNTQAVLYCSKCIELICSKCLGAHSNHLGDMGPVDDATSFNGNYIGLMVDKLKSRSQSMETGVAFWDYYEARLNTSVTIQTAKLDSLKRLIGKLEKLHASLTSDMTNVYQAKINETRKSAAALSTAQGKLDALLKKINSLPPTSTVSSFDWSLVDDVENLLTAYPAPLNFPDLATITVDTLPRDPIAGLDSCADSLQFEQDILPELPKIVREFTVVFKQVSSIDNWAESRTEAIDDRLQVSVIIIPGVAEGESKGKLGLLLKFRCPEGLQFNALYEMSLIHQRLPTEIIRASQNSTVAHQTQVGWVDFCSSQRVLSDPQGFCVNDCIEIRVVLEVQRTWFQQH